MLARMCLLQIVKKYFNEYVPPKGINVAWYWHYDPAAILETLFPDDTPVPDWQEGFMTQKDIDPKDRTWVIAFFTAREKSIDDDDIHKYGALKQEVQVNRCFVCMHYIPRKYWSKCIPNFNPDNDSMVVPFLHPKTNRYWLDRKAMKSKFNALVDKDVFDRVNRDRKKHEQPLLAPNVRKQVIESKDTKMMVMKFVVIEDEIKEEVDAD